MQKKCLFKDLDEIFEAFSSLEPNTEQLMMQKNLYEKFWGGKTYFKTPEEAREIITLSEKLLKVSKGMSKGYQEAVRDALEGANKAKLSSMEKKRLRQAVGK